MLPKGLLTHTVDSLHTTRGISTNLIYSVVLLSICAGVVALPFIDVSITVQSPAVIRPSTEKTTIHSLVNGIVDRSFVKENTIVKRSDTLYILENNLLLERETYLNQRTLELSSFLEDINALTSCLAENTSCTFPDLRTLYYRQALLQFRQRQGEVLLRYQKTKNEYDRSFKLHREQVIADSEFENHSFELDRARQELQTLTTTQLSQWRTDEVAYLKESGDVQFQISQLAREKQSYIIKAPCAGTIISGSDIYTGSAISAGTALAEISPDTSLITEAYVSPNDIGLLSPQMPVTFQIDAFNYNEWGMASGTIVEISNDVLIVGGRPVFKVRCALASNYLALRNGYKGFLKKGMTLSARFVVTQRSLWQLLFDEIDDWINPHINRTQT